jgi:competence protein ComEA
VYHDWDMEHVIGWCKGNVLQAILLTAGMLMMVVGVVQWLTESSKGDEVVISLPQNVPECNHHNEQLIVDVSGAVSKPGVYSVAAGGRMGEVIELAGGFADDVNVNWVAQQLNLAQPVVDGQKIYVPPRGELESQSNESLPGIGSSQGLHVINVNTAPQSILEQLWGIGEVRAEAIIQNRPYSSIEELRTKANIPSNVLERNQAKISF